MYKLEQHGLMEIRGVLRGAFSPLPLSPAEKSERVSCGGLIWGLEFLPIFIGMKAADGGVVAPDDFLPDRKV